jgi:hypothetical protein
MRAPFQQLKREPRLPAVSFIPLKLFAAPLRRLSCRENQQIAEITGIERGWPKGA